MKSLLKLLSGISVAVVSLFRRRRQPRRRQPRRLVSSSLAAPRHAPDPHGLTTDQLAAKAEIDNFLDRNGVGVKVHWGSRRSGKTYLAHVIHKERGGVVVARSRAAAADFRQEHIRMFGEDARVATVSDPYVTRGFRRGTIIMDVQPRPRMEFEAAHANKVISLQDA